MLTFFRKLFDEGNLKSYLVFAFGLLLLLSISILFAFTVNNWNQNRLNAQEEVRIIQDISEEMQRNRFLQEAGSQRIKEVIAAAERLQNVIRNPELRPTKKDIDFDLHKLTWVWLSATPTTIYDALNASGDFGLISSSLLRKKLANFNSNQEKLLQFEAIQGRFVDQQLRPFLNRSIDRTTIHTYQKVDKLITTHHPSQFTTSHDDLLRNREFANILVDLIFFTKRIMLPYDRIEKDISQIDTIIMEKYPSIQAKPYNPY